MLHRDTVGNEKTLARHIFMMMNAAIPFQHEETDARDGPVKRCRYFCDRRSRSGADGTVP